MNRSKRAGLTLKRQPGFPGQLARAATEANLAVMVDTIRPPLQL